MFVSQSSIDSGVVGTYNLKKRVEAVKNCRNISKRDMRLNDAMPKMKVDPETYVRPLLSRHYLCRSGCSMTSNYVGNRLFKPMAWCAQLIRSMNCH